MKIANEMYETAKNARPIDTNRQPILNNFIYDIEARIEKVAARGGYSLEFSLPFLLEGLKINPSERYQIEDQFIAFGYEIKKIKMSKKANFYRFIVMWDEKCFRNRRRLHLGPVMTCY